MLAMIAQRSLGVVPGAGVELGQLVGKMAEDVA